MKKNTVIALASGVVAAGSALYFLLRKRNRSNEDNSEQPQETQEPYHGNTHHLTNVFSNAKKRALHLN